MTQTYEEIAQFMGDDIRWCPEANRWERAKAIIGNQRVTLGPSASQQWLDAPEHLAMVLARYRAAAALIGDAQSVLEIGCGEGIGAGILANGRKAYLGIDDDVAAIDAARNPGPRHSPRRPIWFSVEDALGVEAQHAGAWSAAVALDVIEHIPAEHEAVFLANIARWLKPGGACVIGTPSKNAEHLASPQSRAGHVNLYTPERLQALMAKHFRLVQMVFMQDTSIHLGHPGMAHYVIACGIGPR